MLCFVLDIYLFGRVKGAIFVFVECLLCLQFQSFGLRIRSGWLLVFTFLMFGFVNVEKSWSWMLAILKLGLFNGLLVVIRIVCSYIM